MQDDGLLRLIRIWAYLMLLLFVVLWWVTGCASNPPTCPPKDTRCEIMLAISKIDIGPKK